MGAPSNLADPPTLRLGWRLFCRISLPSKEVGQVGQVGPGSQERPQSWCGGGVGPGAARLDRLAVAATTPPNGGWFRPGTRRPGERGERGERCRLIPISRTPPKRVSRGRGKRSRRSHEDLPRVAAVLCPARARRGVVRSSCVPTAPQNRRPRGTAVWKASGAGLTTGGVTYASS